MVKLDITLRRPIGDTTVLLGGIDFETFSEIDIRKEGLHNYMAHPSFRVLMGSVSADREFMPYDKDYFFGVDHAPEIIEILKDDLNRILNKAYAYTSDSCTPVLAAHNAEFEAGCFKALGIDLEELGIELLDTAMLSRAAGGSSSLAKASEQFLEGEEKMEEGLDLIKLFSIPNERNKGRPFTHQEIQDDPDLQAKWDTYAKYCRQDASLTRQLASQLIFNVPRKEMLYQSVTSYMNRVGWHVDLDLVDRMQTTYEANNASLLNGFAQNYDAELNLSSPLQLQKWCLDRGIKATSFNKLEVEKLIFKISKRLDSGKDSDEKAAKYSEVLEMLLTKQALGGAALKKLQVIKDNVGSDSRLRNQYLHVGAGQTFRTTGRGVQMQNLKRLGANKLDTDSIQPDVHIPNEMLGENLRQVFTSSHPEGKLFVADFSSIENRSLAWLAGDKAKIQAFHQNQDMYKIAAAKIFNVSYDDVTPDQRQVGKVAELSCGYQGASGAVSVFAKVYGLDLDDEMIKKIYVEWRQTNPEIVKLWEAIDNALHSAVLSPDFTGAQEVRLPYANMFIQFVRHSTPPSLQKMHPGAVSIQMSLHYRGMKVLSRMFHGCYTRGNSICFYKPAEAKTGPPWSPTYVNQVTKNLEYHSIYGGKLTGILNQSLCREIFFIPLVRLKTFIEDKKKKGSINIEMIGQFHDEVIIDWHPPVPGEPNHLSEEEFEAMFHEYMTATPTFMTSDDIVFPLEADIKSDYRYIK